MSIIDPEIYDRCLKHYAQVRDLDFVFKPSIPIPYFGDVKAYADSPLRVLTAALNPSDVEFRERRFDVQKGLNGPLELEQELSAYFKRKPYRRWFSSFEPLLNGLDASYGGLMSNRHLRYGNTALHLDMCSPIATTPTWSNLLPHQRSVLTDTGREVFERLVDALKPDIIIASLRWSHIESWHSDFRAGRSWNAVQTYTSKSNGTEMKRRLLVQARRLSSAAGHSFLFVNGTAAYIPFGFFSNLRKCEVGAELLAEIKAPAE